MPSVRFQILAGVALLAVVAACVETLTDLGPGEVVEVRLSLDSAALRLDRTLTLSAFPVDASGAFRPGLAVIWSSAQPGIATVNDSGLVTPVAAGNATVTATVEGVEGRALVTVAVPPALAFTRDSLGFTAQAGGAEPAPDTAGIRNAGGFTLEGLSVDTIVYDAGAADWLMAAIDSIRAPATLTLTPMSATVTTAATFGATVQVSAADAAASPGAVRVTLTITPGAPANVAVDDGDGQSAAVGSAVATDPSVLVTDMFENPVPGATVVFTITGGGGSVTGDTATTNAQGIARVAAWTLGTATGMNTLSASLMGAGAAVVFTATATPGAADAIESNGGDGQSAVAGFEVGVPPRVLVMDQFDNGVPGVTVTFAVASGGGTITGATQTTDTDGLASVGSWTLGEDAGPNTLTASATGLTGSPVTFTADGISGDAENLVLDGGDAQIDTVAATLPVPYTVRVTDTNGNGVPGVSVAWEVTSGGGSITMSATTDSLGVSSATRVLGTVAGIQEAEASVGGLTPERITFTATALAGAADEVALEDGGGQSDTVNTTVAVPPAVLVTDQFGNPVSGHDVTFAVTAGGGTVDPATAIATDGNGIARVTAWTLGTTAGMANNTLTATAAGAGITGNPVTFTATAVADVAANIAIMAGDSLSAVSETAIPTDPAVRVTDQFGNDVAGEAVTFQVTGGGGAVTGGTPTTNASGVAAVGSWSVRATGPGDDLGRTGNTLEASIAAGASVTFTGFGVFSYETHVHPKWDQGCLGCHGGVAGLELNPDAATSYAALVGVNPVCDTDGSLVPQGYRRIATGGGTAARDLSILWTFIAPPTPLVGDCDAQYMPNADGMSTGARDTIQAWIKNGAPDN